MRAEVGAVMIARRARGDVLVRLSHASGVAAVVRDRRSVARLLRGGRSRAWLTTDLDADLGTELAGRQPSVEGLTNELLLTGGLLPDGAVRAIAVDRGGRAHEAVVGEHAWLALLREPSHGGRAPIVRFLDASGGLVGVPLPDEVELQPVHDADEPCPVCRSADWALIVASGRAADGGRRDGRRSAVCRRCGHQERLPVLLAPPVAVSASPDESFASIAPPPAADLRSLDFDVYGVTGLTPTVVGHGGKREKVDRVSLAFVTGDDRITVGTDSPAPLTSSAELARQALDALLQARESTWPDRPHLSESAYGLWLNGRARARAAAAAAASAGDLTLPVDGTPTRCVSVTDGECFAAVARLSAATITIAGRGDPARLALEALPEDMLRRLAGS